MFITFTQRYEHFLDNIKNGFRMGEHKVQFDPSTFELVRTLIPFWDEYDFKGPFITFIRDLRTSHSGLTEAFWKDLGAKMKSDSQFNVQLSLLFGQFRSVPIKMKCFTEIRANQRINPRHAGYFGKFGILMNAKWMSEKGGCPVIYVGKSINVTNVMAKNFAILNLLDAYVKKCTNVRSLAVSGAFFDLVSFMETAENSNEYEWRIVSGHNLGGESFLPKVDRLSFSAENVHSLFVPDEGHRVKTVQFLKEVWGDSVYVPKVLLTEDILLSEEDSKSIEAILSRGNI
ncbi:MAG: hypothetical protein K2X47_03715 [Bdellovibrionales bacterium]|nr:hypothetical protein [Bdellovibrionales bacterium]